MLKQFIRIIIKVKSKKTEWSELIIFNIWGNAAFTTK